VIFSGRIVQLPAHGHTFVVTQGYIIGAQFVSGLEVPATNADVLRSETNCLRKSRHRNCPKNDPAVGDDYWRYGIESNRKELELTMRYIYEHRLVKRQIGFEELFDPSLLKT